MRNWSSSGYTDVWSAETDGSDGFTPLALAAAWTRPSSWVWPSSPPTPGARRCWPRAWPPWPRRPGRFTFGLGTSSDVIVSRWNGIEFAEPYKRVRDTIRFLRSALAGEKVDHDYETFTVRGFRLARPVEHPPPIFLAALRPGMLRLAGREADGVILNWLSAEDVATVKPELGADIPVAARIFVCPSEDTDTARAVGRRMIAAYLNVGVYAAFHRWLGRGPELEPMWDGVAGGRPEGGAGRHPRRGGRRPGRPRVVRRVPGPRGPVRGQRDRHPGDGGDPDRRDPGGRGERPGPAVDAA